MWSSTSIYLRTSAVFLYVSDMKEAVNYDLFLYVDDSCLVYQHNDVRIYIRILRIFAIGLLIINKVFILDKLKQNAYYLAQTKN